MRNYSNPYVAAAIRQANIRKVEQHIHELGARILDARRNPAILANVEIFDTTARDGMQMHRAFVNPYRTRMKSKIEVVQRIMEWGIPAIEVGYPGSSAEELEAAQKLAAFKRKKGFPTTLVGLAGTIKEHIKAVKDAELDEVHIFSSGSIAHAYTKFGKMPEELVPGIVEAVQYAVKLGFGKILVSLEDAFSADPDHVVNVANRVFDAAKGRGIRYNIPDTIGVADPAIAFAYIRYVAERTGVPIDVHFHNDGDTAATNSIYAVLGGASRIQATVGGLGERAGNASISKIIVQMNQHYGVIPNDVYGKHLDISQMKAVAEFVEVRSGIRIPQQEPGIGKYVFAHASGIHANGYLKSVIRDGVVHSIYVAVNPTIYGNEEKVVRGPLAGESNHKITLMDFGINIEHPEVAAKIKEISDYDKAESAKKHVSDAEYLLNVYRIITGRECNALSIQDKDISIHVSGTGASAEIVATIEGKTETGIGTGNGPVDAAVCAIKRAIEGKGSHLPIIIDYDNHSIGSGSDASAEAQLTIKNGGKPMETSSIGPNTTVIAIKAYVQAYNALHALAELQQRYGGK